MPYYATHIYTGDGSTNTFAVNFTLGYLHEDHVKVQVEGEAELREITFITPGLVDIGTAPGTGLKVFVYRDTPKEYLVHSYMQGASITAQNIDESNLQSVLINHENLDATVNLIEMNEILDIAEGHSEQAGEYAFLAGTYRDDAQDRANDALVHAEASHSYAADSYNYSVNALSYRDDALDFRNTAESYKDQAVFQAGLASESAEFAEISSVNADFSSMDSYEYMQKSAEWAQKAEDLEVDAGQFSSLHYAAKAAASEDATAADVIQSGAYVVQSNEYAELSKDWAEKVEDSEVVPGSFSSLHHASKSQVSASDAAVSAANAEGFAIDASVYSNLGLGGAAGFDFGLVSDTVEVFPTDYGTLI